MRKKFIKKLISVILTTALVATTFNYTPIKETHTVYAAEYAFADYEKIDGIGDATILGVDFTRYQQDLGWGKSYFDYKSVEIENLFDFFKTQGANTVSVKVAVNPDLEKDYTACLTLDNAIKTVKAANESGLNTNIILYYSDDLTYADVQTLPQEWTEADSEAEETDTPQNHAISYTKDVIKALEDADALPSIITIGNETNYNFLNITDGSGWDGFVAMGDISKIIKEAGIKVAIGAAAPDTASDIKWFVEKLGYADVSYDYLGVNIYPNADTNTYMKEMVSTFDEVTEGKQLFVSGVYFQRKSSTDETVTDYTQADQVYNLLKSTISQKNYGGMIWNEAEYVGSWNGIFDENGVAHISAAIYAYAKGENVDTSTWRNPYQYGDETGDKDITVDINKIDGFTDDTIRGMDISSYLALKEAGVKYYDYDGNEQPLLKILNDNGINWIRLRVWNDPYNEAGDCYGGGNCSAENMLKIAKEASEYNIKVLLDFHYSDFWADPDQQILPKSWNKDADDPEKLEQDIYDYTVQVLTDFKEAGVDVGMVQVGNEITNGFMGIVANRDAGESYTKIWGSESKSKQIDKYLISAVNGVREVLPNTLVALHLESPDVKKYETIMNVWERDGVDYDVLGTSYYPFWSVSAKLNTPASLEKVIKLAASKGKYISVFETAWCYTLEDGDGTPNSIGSVETIYKNTTAYGLTPQAQVDMLTDLYTVLCKYENTLGAFYWEGAWIPVKAGWNNWKENKEIADIYGTGWASAGALGYFNESKMYYKGEPAWGGCSWENNAFFDIHGNTLQSLKFYTEAVNHEEIAGQSVSVRFMDRDGKIIYETEFFKLNIGETKEITIPEIQGYTLDVNCLSPAIEDNKITVTGTEYDSQLINIIYDKNPEEIIEPVIKKDVEIKTTKENYTVSYGNKLNLSKKLKYTGDGELRYKSGNTKVVKINKKTGEIITVGIGTAKIRIRSTETDSCNPVKKYVTITVRPASQKTAKVKSSQHTITIKFNKDKKATGYEIMCYTSDSSVTNVTTKSSFKVRINTKKISKYTLKNLAPGLTYKIKVRSYKIVNDTTYYGKWSKRIKVKTRKAKAA